MYIPQMFAQFVLVLRRVVTPFTFHLVTVRGQVLVEVTPANKNNNTFRNIILQIILVI